MGTAFVEWNGQLPHALEQGAVRTNDAHLVRRLPADCSVLVVGPDGIPASELDRFGGQVVQLAQRGAGKLPRVREPGPAVRCVVRRQLVREVRYWGRTLPLQRLSAHEWIARRGVIALGEDARLIRLLPQLATLRADEWRSTSGLSVRAFDRAISRMLATTPGRAVKQYRLATAKWLKAHRYRLDELAVVAGYSSKQAVSLALRARR